MSIIKEAAGNHCETPKPQTQMGMINKAWHKQEMFLGEYGICVFFLWGGGTTLLKTNMTM